MGLLTYRLQNSPNFHEKMDPDTDFARNPLVVWAEATFHNGKPFSSANEVIDPEFLNKMLNDIDPLTFKMVHLQQASPGDLNLKVQNLVEVVRSVKQFYQEKLQQLLVMKMPDFLILAKEPDSGHGLEELKKFLLMILGCAVQCERKEYFIEKIKEMDFEVQTQLVPYIQEITENSEKILSFRPNEIGDFSQDQLVALAEGMYFQLQKILEERDDVYEAVLDMNLERHELVSKEAELDVVRSPPMSPSRTGSIKTSVVLKANKQRIRDLQNELEERNMQVTEFKEEITNLKTTIENIRQENKSLLSEARWVKSYRDEIDVLKSQVDKVNKLETENSKYREKLRELDFYKKRFDELKEQHELLYETKLVLEEQVAGTSTKIERCGHLEEENDRLHTQLKIIMEEREINQQKLKEMMDENAKLQMEKQESMLEVVQLNQRINLMKDRSPDGNVVPLSMEYKESSSTQLLRLEKENKHLTKLVESLREGTPKIRELEKEIGELEENLEKQRAEVKRLTDELEKERSKAGEWEGVAETHINQIHRLKSRLSQKSMKVDNLSAALAMKEAITTKRSLSREKDEKNNNMRDEDGADGDDILSSKHFMELKNEVEEKDSAIRTLQKRLRDEEQKIKKMDMEVAQKAEESLVLETRVEECKTYSAKVEEQLLEREKTISELERRFESTSTQNKTLNQTVKLKEDKIAALEERVSHLMDSASQDTRKVNQTIEEKLKQIRDLHAQLEECKETAHNNEKLKATLRQRDEKLNSLITSNRTLETQMHEFEIQYEKSTGQCKKLEHALKLKNEQISSLEASLNEYEGAVTKQTDEKVVSLKKALDVKNEEVADLEARIDEMASLNNKLKSSNRGKDDRIQSLEEELAALEEKSSHSNGEKIEVLMKRLQKKADEIVNLENCLEDVTAAMRKHQRNSESKEDLIQRLENDLKKYKEASQNAEKLSETIEEKNRRIFELQTEVDDINGEVRRLEMAAKQKEERYITLEKSLIELEDSKADKGNMNHILKAKETKILSQQTKIDDQENRIVQLENELEEKDSKLKRLSHSLKIKEEQIQTNEERINELADLQNENVKLRNSLYQKEEKILDLTDRLDELSELARTHQRLKESTKQKEDKIISLQERIDDLEDVVNINERLNQQLHQKDERITVLQTKVHENEDALQRAEKFRSSFEKSANDEIQELRKQVDDLMDVKVKRQLSIRRREEKIMTLESRLQDVASDQKHKEGRIQELQSRLQGTMSQYRKLDLSNEEKDEKIRDLEARVSELQNTYQENRNLSTLVQQSAERINTLTKRSEDAETSTQRLKGNIKDLENQLSGLQERLEDTLNLNSKLDHHVKNKDEKIKELESLLQAEEDRNEEKNDAIATKERVLTRQKSKIEELETALMAREKDVCNLESRMTQLSVVDDNQGKVSNIAKEKDVVISNLQNTIKSLELAAAKQESFIVQANKDKDSKIDELQKRITEISTEKHKMKFSMQEKDGIIIDLQRSIEELNLTKTDHDKMNHILNEKNSQLKYLRETLEQYEKDVAQMETRIEGSHSDLNRAKGSIKQKVGRITTLKSQLEEAVSKNHSLASELGLKREKISNLEKSVANYKKKESMLKKELEDLMAEFTELKNKPESEKVNVTEKVQLTKRASESQSTPQQANSQKNISDSQITALENQLDLLQQEKKHLVGQNDEISSRNASLQTENESLRSELDLLNQDYEVLQEEMSEAKEHYKDLDMSATKISHRCEVLVQLNGTLEEENRALMEQLNKLLEQNQSLLVKTLESRDTYLEDERAFSDRLYMLEREKEKLMERVDAANKAMINMSSTGKKKNMFVRGAHKVLKKAGLRKVKKDEDQSVILTKVYRSPEDLASDQSDSSFNSPLHDPYQRNVASDEGSVHSSNLTGGSSLGPIRSALSRSKQNLYDLDASTALPREDVVLRRSRFPDYITDSVSSGSESGERRARPRSEFILPLAEYHVPSRRNQQRPQSMDVEELYNRSNVFRTSSNEMNDRDSVPGSARKISVTSSKSTGSNPQNEVSFGVYGTPGNVAKDSPVEGKRVVKKVIQDGSPSMPSKVNTSSHPGEADIVMYSDASDVSAKRVTIQATSHSTPKSAATDKRSDVNGTRSSPLVGKSGVFYQPSEREHLTDLPEADQKATRADSLPQERSDVGASATVNVRRGPIPSYEEATRRSNSGETIVRPKEDTVHRASEVVSRKNEKVKNHEEGGKKKSSVWYEYGEV